MWVSRLFSRLFPRAGDGNTLDLVHNNVKIYYWQNTHFSRMDACGLHGIGRIISLYSSGVVAPRFLCNLPTPGTIRMKNKLLLILILTAYFGVALADGAKKEEPKADVAAPKAESSVTSHQVKIDGNTIRYKAVRTLNF